MACRRRVTSESSSSSDSDFSSASGSDDDTKMKSSECPRSGKKDNEDPSYPGRTQDLGEVHPSGVQQVVITAIRASDLTLGLQRIPSGFHIVVKANGAEYQTSNESVHVNQAFVEWHDRIILPCDPSFKVCVSVYASFELGPMVCHGELLRTFEISVGELLDRSEKSHPIIFQSKQEEVVSACTSLFMSVERRLFDQNDATVLRPITTLTTCDMDGLAFKTDAGHHLLGRYRRTQNSRDLDESTSHFERALDLCPMDHPYRAAALFNLATAKFIRCQANGAHVDLDIHISLFQEALDLRPTGHPDRPITQLHLAIALLSRFAKQGFQTDVDTAEELLAGVLDVCHTNSHIYRAALVTIETSALHSARSIDANNLEQDRPATPVLPLSPIQLAHRVEQCLQRDEPRDLDEVISLHYDALGYYNTGLVYAYLLVNLAGLLGTRFEHRGNDKDLDQAIVLQTEALALLPVGDTTRYMPLNNLAVHLSTRFDRRGNDDDLDQAIALHGEVLVLLPVGDPYRFRTLNSLMIQLSTRFDRRGNDEDLDQAIAFHREALALLPVGDPKWSSTLNSLVNQLSARFDRRGNDEDSDQAIALLTEALALRPVGHTDRPSSLNNLAIQLSSRFDRRGNDEDLNQAITLFREALALRPVGHPDRFISLNNLAVQLFSRFDRRGNDEDLDQAIVLRREALALFPVGHPDRSISLNNLANRLSIRFERQGNDDDLDQAIILRQEALALRSVGHPDRSLSLNILAIQLSTRYDRRGNDEDLDQAITLRKEVLVSYPVGHTDRPSSSNHLAAELSTRFDHRGNDEDLDQAIALNREALALCPVGDPDRSNSLNSLSNQLSIHFDHRGDDEDLSQTIALHREALALRPVGHEDRTSSLNNLAVQLSTRLNHRGNDDDLDQAIALLGEVLALSPVDHTVRSKSLNNLAVQLYARFKHRSNDEDLDQAIALLKEALALHAGKRWPWSQSHRYNKKDLDESRETLCRAFALLTQHDPRQLLFHQSLANVYIMFHQSGLDGTGAGEDTDSLNAAMDHLKAAANVVSGGSLSRLRAYATSMQLLDAYMSTTASVSSRHNIMKEFPSTLAADAASCALRSGDVRRAVELLEQGRTIIWTQMTRLRTPLDSFQTRDDHATALMKKFKDLSSLLDNPPANYSKGAEAEEEEEARYRRLVEDWNGTVKEIRQKIDGFSRFLLPPEFSDLQDAARGGPIIVLIASESSCHAIIIPHKQPPASIQLPIDLKKLKKLKEKLHRTVSAELHRQDLEYGGARRPSLISCRCTLLARRNDKSLSVSFGAVGQDHPAGYSFTLDNMEPELELVRSLLSPIPTISFTKITSVDATRSRALRALQDNTWLHLSCHGIQEFHEPFKSAFLMRDEPLSLLDIAQMDLSLHEFAFLSGCETAVGDDDTPDEVIHLAAGLQFAGVKSVIGTLWKVKDSTVQRLVEEFYKNFCGDGKMNSKRAARALHRAVQSLVNDKDIALDQRIVFVHIGI
ncbi:CHAT domain-containing protein [Suillus variegatus]|nr:CHAT domain-containing protein [Suillus variegatus]